MRIIKLTCPIEAGKHLSMCILPTAIDCETTGLDTRVDTILSVQVCSLSTSNIIYYLLPTALHGLLSIPTTTRLVFHNFKFDVRMLKRHHIVLPHPIADTSLMHHLYDENASHRLDDIVKSFYNDNYKEQFWLKYKTYPEAPEAEQLDYACKDAYYTLRLYTDLLSRLRRDGVPSTLITHVHRLALALFDTEEKGVRIDVGYLTQLGVKHKTELERLKVELSACASEHIECIVEDRYQVELAKRKTERGKANVTRPEFNWDSIPDVRNLVYERMRLPKQTTRQKKVTLDADALEALRGKHPLIGKLLEYREHQKVYTSFIEGTLDKMLDGRIHPSFNVNGTVTGRISGNSPNLQQLPRDGGVRGIYLPDEGHVLLAADFQQLEIVLSAHFSQDSLLLETIRNGDSLHTVTANALGITRDQAKQINFSIVYGCTEFRISSILGCNLHEAKRVFEKLWDTYKGLHNVIKQCHDCVENGTPIINAYGRRRRFNTDFCNHWDLERMKRQAFNAKVQGTGADLTNRAFYLVSEAMRKRGLGRALFLIHDELLVSTPLHCVNEVRELLVGTMEAVGKEIGLTLPLKASCSEAMERWVK